MVLELPSDAEPFIPEGGDLSDLSEPGVYCLTLTRPDDLASSWDRQFDTRPDYWHDLTHCTRVAYVGAASDVLRRLEEHRDGNKRKAALLEICEPTGVLNIKFFNNTQQAFDREFNLAQRFNQQHPEFYVHQR